MLISLFQARTNQQTQVEVSLYFYLRTPVDLSLPSLILRN